MKSSYVSKAKLKKFSNVMWFMLHKWS